MALPIKVLVACVAMLLLGVQESEARLHPYYVVRNATDDIVLKPRILFVLDTSGSMTARAMPGIQTCLWQTCESDAYAGTNLESRVSAARRAIHQVINSTGDAARFALMTFEQNDPHVNRPPTCSSGARFSWIWASAYPGLPWDLVYPNGYAGSWHLCQGFDTRPYPYIRWDFLGQGSVIGSNNQVGAVPPSPLISTDYSDMSDWQNGWRPVQWFPEFLGVRFHPDDITDPGRELTYETVGDYGNTAYYQDLYVWEQDFYYWPYVDGFPGYSHWSTHPAEVGNNTGGVAGVDFAIARGRLYSPFYFDFSDPGGGPPLIDPAVQGPTSETEAQDAVLARTSPLIYGGVDAVGLTPWASTIGTVPNVITESNAAGSHSTVASYLSFVTDVDTADSCAPTAAVLITDGEPYPVAEAGAVLYERLANLREDLGVNTYVVGFFLAGSVALNDMACAAAGACDGGVCTTPCDDTPTDGWDTCADPGNPAGECAYLSSSAEELQAVLTQIVENIGDFDVPSGPGSTANEFGVTGSAGSDDQVEALQTTLAAGTDFPSWQGHVTRGLCDHRDDAGDLLPSCVDPGFPYGAANPCTVADDCGPGGLCSGGTCQDEETFGPCPRSRTWDAGECLQQTNVDERRLYTHDINNELVAIAQQVVIDPDPLDADGDTSHVRATSAFRNELAAAILAEDPAAAAPTQDDANRVATFLYGMHAPSDWKLPGLASSAPIIVRRVPPYNPDFRPSVALSDPHCGGRLLGAADGVPPSLEEYAEEAWEESNLLSGGGFASHYEAQEAVLIGDDFGVLHAFQLNSGNELFGFVPRAILASLAEKAEVGPLTYGQEGELDEHSYGLSATLNVGWVFDDRDADPNNHTWRQLGIMGMGPGGRDYLVLDLSHMSPNSSRGPFEVMWTSEDPALAADYDRYAGETWARPALGYHVPGEVSTNAPDAYYVLGSGYPVDGTFPEEGRTLLQVEALTGQIVDYAVVPAVPASELYEPSYGTIVDPAISSHCLSRLWAEMQEVYVADPAGRVFRWDLGRDTAHVADSGGLWGTAATAAIPAIPACTGGLNNCSIVASNPGEPFSFAPAVTSNDRLDDITSASSAGPLTPSDQFLVALAGGAPADDALHEGDGLEYHSSLFVLVDDHSADPTAGFTIPAGAPKTDPGTDAAYMRMALSDITRTRTITPYPGATPFEETQEFTRQTRPLRAPRIFVTGAVIPGADPADAPTIIDGVEVYFIEFTVYEPPARLCDRRFYDAANDEWYEDPGTTFVLTFRLTADVASGFDLINGADAAAAGGGGGGTADFGSDAGLILQSVQQVGTGQCADGGCGAQLGNPSSVPCDNNSGGGGVPTGSGSAIAVSSKELSAFTPVE